VTQNLLYEMLPKRTAICRQYRKCRNPACRCRRGEQHGPYYFFFYRVDGRLRKLYIRKADAEDMWKSYSLAREIRKKRAADRKQSRELCRVLRSINTMLTAYKRMK
jgi:hypothetical protein